MISLQSCNFDLFFYYEYDLNNKSSKVCGLLLIKAPIFAVGKEGTFDTHPPSVSPNTPSSQTNVCVLFFFSLF